MSDIPRLEARFFAGIGFPHAEDVAYSATRSVSDDDQTIGEPAVADHSAFAIILARIFNLDVRTLEDGGGVREIEAAITQRLQPLGWIEADMHCYCIYKYPA